MQTCVVHLIRASMRFVSYQDRKAVAAALRPIYTAATADAAAGALDDFDGSELGRKYPATVSDLAERLGTVHPVPGVPAASPQDHLHHQRDRVAELPAPQDHQEPRPLPQRRGRGQTALAGHPRHRGQTRPRTRQIERQNPREPSKPVNKLVEGALVQGWSEALGILVLNYPDRIGPYLNR